MMYKFCFFVPETHVEAVKKAMFDAGGGKIGNYDCCAWQTLGQGQFRPLEQSQPYLGEQGQVTRVEEYKVEMVCAKNALTDVFKAFKASHPYEEPAYDIYAVIELNI